MDKYTLEDLKGYDGSAGTTYVAYKGKVYDISSSYLWEDGLHQDIHQAGSDLTDTLEDEAPHDPDLLEAFPVVGELVNDEDEKDGAEDFSAGF